MATDTANAEKQADAKEHYALDTIRNERDKVKEKLLLAGSQLGIDKDWSKVTAFGDVALEQKISSYIATNREYEEKQDQALKELSTFQSRFMTAVDDSVVSAREMELKKYMEEGVEKKSFQATASSGWKYPDIEEKSLKQFDIPGISDGSGVFDIEEWTKGPLLPDSSADFKGDWLYNLMEQSPAWQEAPLEPGTGSGPISYFKGLTHKALFQRPQGYEVTETEPRWIQYTVQERPSLISVMPEIVTSEGMVRWLDEVQFLNEIGYVPEGQELPESGAEIRLDRVDLETMGTHIPVTYQMLRNKALSLTYLRQTLRRMMDLFWSGALALHDGGDGEIRGFPYWVRDPKFQTALVGKAPYELMETVNDAAFDIERDTGYMASHWAVTPADYKVVRRGRIDDSAHPLVSGMKRSGEYIIPLFSQQGWNSVGDVQVLLNGQIAGNTSYVFPASACVVFSNGAPGIQMAEMDSDDWRKLTKRLRIHYTACFMLKHSYAMRSITYKSA